MTSTEHSLRQTPLHDQHVSLGARMVPYAGWSMPVLYSGIVAEHTAVRERAGLFDVSHMGRLEVRGPRALLATNRLITNDLEKLQDGGALYACACRADGGILDDLIIYRHNSERVLVICNAANHAKIAAHFARELGAGAELNDLSAASGLLALQGPRAQTILTQLGLTAAPHLRRFSFCHDQLGSTAVLAARTGYTGEDGFEIVIPAGDLVTCWKQILEAGSSLGMLPVGLGARDTLRLEACLSLYGHEIDEATHPFEAGIGFAVRLNKADYIGKTALDQLKSSPPKRKLVGLMMQGRGIARENYPLLDTDHRVIGKVTSGGPAPTLGANIALGYVPVELASEGTHIDVDCRGKIVPAKIVSTPFYKRTT